MKKIKILTLVLACLMLVSVFAACGEDSGKTNETTKEQKETENPVAELPPLEAKNYNNHDFVVLWPEEHVDGHWIRNEIDQDEQSSDRILNEVYKRNLKVENDYNITISSTLQFCSTIATSIRMDATSETPEYDAFFSNLGGGKTPNKNLRSITIEGIMADWNEAEYYDESMTWWQHDLMEDYSLGGARYYAFGDIIYSDNYYPYIIYYNRDMLERYGIEDNLSELVASKEWTIDKLIEICQDVPESEDDVWDENDTYGCLVSNTAIQAVYYGFGRNVNILDEDGYPEWVMTPDYVAAVAPKIRDFFNNDNICGNTNVFSKALGGSDVHADLSRDMFMNNQGLFSVAELIFAERLATNNNTVSYGLLPMPLFNSNQERYCCVLNDATILGIPANQDLTRTSHILSALSRESVETLTPAFFGIVLQAKYLNDAESVKMLNMILNETLKAPDVATRFAYGNSMMNKFIDMIVAGNVDFQSIYDANIETAEAEIEALIEQLDFYQNQ